MNAKVVGERYRRSRTIVPPGTPVRAVGGSWDGDVLEIDRRPVRLLDQICLPVKGQDRRKIIGHDREWEVYTIDVVEGFLRWIFQGSGIQRGSLEV